MAILTLICTSCGQYYRPIITPLNNTPPNPSNFHDVYALNSNGSYAANPPQSASPAFSFDVGTATEIDVSGATLIGETWPTRGGPPTIGINPTHIATLANNSRLFTVSAGSIEDQQPDVFASFTPATGSSGFGTLTTVTLPGGSLPVFVTSTQPTTAYVANYGSNSVSVINTSSNFVSNVVPTGAKPIALAQVQSNNGNKLYVANQGGNSVNSFNTIDMSANTVTGFTGVTPSWMVARNDGQKVYVLTSGDGNLFTIDTATDTISSVLPVGAGANYVFFDATMQRLFVTNPANSTLTIFSATGSTGDTPTLLKTINITGSTVAGNYPACVNPCPVSVAVLPDGNEAYVASYTLSGCTDPTFSASCQVTPQVTVIDASALSNKMTLYPLSMAQGGTVPTAVPEVPVCVPSIPYSPEGLTVPGTGTIGWTTRFRLSTAAAADSSNVYIGICDAGTVAVIATASSSVAQNGGNVSDALTLDLQAPFGSGFPLSNGEPPPMNPIFMLPGQ